MKVRKVNRNGSITYEIEIATVRYVLTEKEAISLSSAISVLALSSTIKFTISTSSDNLSLTGFVSEDEEE